MATVEVENIISKYLDSSETIVYGVEIPGEEGKAGMAVITTEKQIDFKHLYAHLKDNLPTYARLLFIRYFNKIIFVSI